MKLAIVLLLSVVVTALAVVLLGVKVFFVKGGRFPSVHAHHIAEKSLRKENKQTINH